MHEQGTRAQSCPTAYPGQKDQDKDRTKHASGAETEIREARKGHVPLRQPEYTFAVTPLSGTISGKNSGTHLADARHPSQAMANSSRQVTPAATQRFHAPPCAYTQKSRIWRRLREHDRWPMRMHPATWRHRGLHRGSCTPAVFPTIRCFGRLLHATDVTSPNMRRPSGDIAWDITGVRLHRGHGHSLVVH